MKTVKVEKEKATTLLYQTPSKKENATSGAKKGRVGLLLKHIMPVKPTDLTPRDRTLPHTPPHSAHFPAAATADVAASGVRITDVPSPAAELLHDPAESLVRVAAFAERGDGFVAELDDLQGGCTGGKKDARGAEEGRLGDGGNSGKIEVMEGRGCPRLGLFLWTDRLAGRR